MTADENRKDESKSPHSDPVGNGSPFRLPRLHFQSAHGMDCQASFLWSGRGGGVCGVAGRRLMLFIQVLAVLVITGPSSFSRRPFAMGQSAVASVLEATSAESPAEGTGGLSATIVDPTGAVIPGAIVTLSRQGARAATATSDGQGMLLVSNLQPGDYALEVRAKGFSVVKRSHVSIHAGHVQRLTIKLPVEVQQQQVQVNGNELDSSP